MTSSAIVSKEGQPMELPEHRAKPVDLKEITRHAKSNCTRCSGRGHYTDGDICKCAVDRFLRANRGKARWSHGRLVWVPEGEVYDVDLGSGSASTSEAKPTRDLRAERLARIDAEIQAAEMELAEIGERFAPDLEKLTKWLGEQEEVVKGAVARWDATKARVREMELERDRLYQEKRLVSLKIDEAELRARSLNEILIEDHGRVGREEAEAEHRNGARCKLLQKIHQEGRVPRHRLESLQKRRAKLVGAGEESTGHK